MRDFLAVRAQQAHGAGYCFPAADLGNRNCNGDIRHGARGGLGGLCPGGLADFGAVDGGGAEHDKENCDSGFHGMPFLGVCGSVGFGLMR